MQHAQGGFVGLGGSRGRGRCACVLDSGILVVVKMRNSFSRNAPGALVGGTMGDESSCPPLPDSPRWGCQPLASFISSSLEFWPALSIARRSALDNGVAA